MAGTKKKKKVKLKKSPSNISNFLLLLVGNKNEGVCSSM
jgi:hypothetical protein